LGLTGLGGGVWLVAIGGSPYYLLVGLGLILSGALLLARRAAALWIYALIVLGTLGWSVSETGLRWWPLAARGDVIFLVGLWLLLPWITGRLAEGERPAAVWRRGGLALTLSLVVAAAVGGAAMLGSRDPMEVAGRLPTEA